MLQDLLICMEVRLYIGVHKCLVRNGTVACGTPTSKYQRTRLPTRLYISIPSRRDERCCERRGRKPASGAASAGHVQGGNGVSADVGQVERCLSDRQTDRQTDTDRHQHDGRHGRHGSETVSTSRRQHKPHPAPQLSPPLSRPRPGTQLTASPEPASYR